MERLRHLVVIIPGIGGSVLEDSERRYRWGPKLTSIARQSLRPEDLSLAEYPRLTPVDLLPTIGLIRPLMVPGYDRLVRQICNAFAETRVDVAAPGRDRDLGADVVLFPYDFRLGVRDAAEHLAAEINDRLRPLTEQARNQRVIVVAHSMGGLVARYWLGPLGGARDCRALVTVGTPHRGAPKALDMLLNGFAAGPLSFGRVSQVLREWPSIYDLLPRYPAVSNAENIAAGALYPHELDGAAPGWFVSQARQSYEMHREIEDAWGELGDTGRAPEVIALFARGHATPSRAVLSDAKVRVLREDPEWLPNPGWHGDGTVPANSAIPIELDEDRRGWRAVPERHLPMASAPALIDILRSYAGASLAAMRGETPDRPWLGLDLEEIVAEGQPVEVNVDLLGADPGESTTVWVTTRSEEGARHRCTAAPLTETAGGRSSRHCNRGRAT